jgi:hypothetical protein
MQGSSTPTLGKKSCGARAVSSKSGWEERFEEAFGAIHPDESNPEKKLVVGVFSAACILECSRIEIL